MGRPDTLAQRVPQHPGGVHATQANSLQREAESLLEGAEFEVESTAVLELVRDSECSAYDCEFIALAIKLDTKLVTMDEKLLQAFPTRTIALSAG